MSFSALYCRCDLAQLAASVVHLSISLVCRILQVQILPKAAHTHVCVFLKSAMCLGVSWSVYMFTMYISPQLLTNKYLMSSWLACPSS